MNDGISSWWRLCESVTVMEATLLLIGAEPENFASNSRKPKGYEPVSNAISRALIAGSIKGEANYYIDFGEQSLDTHKSTVEVNSLKEWLLGKGINTGFFFPGNATSLPGYLAPSHPRYSPRLAAAIKAWQAMEDANLYAGKSPKKAMENWLESNYKALGLAHKKSSEKHRYKEGDINRTAIEEAAKIATWQEDGGAPKTPESKTKGSGMPFHQLLPPLSRAKGPSM